MFVAHLLTAGVHGYIVGVWLVPGGAICLHQPGGTAGRRGHGPPAAEGKISRDPRSQSDVSLRPVSHTICIGRNAQLIVSYRKIILRQIIVKITCWRLSVAVLRSDNLRIVSIDEVLATIVTKYVVRTRELCIERERGH